MHLASLTAKVSSFLAIIALVFVFSGVEGKATCPPGYTTDYAIKWIGSCYVTTTFCYKYSPIMGTASIIIDNVSFSPCTITPDFWEKVTQSCLDQMCAESILPPCNEKQIVVDVSRKACYKLNSVMVIGGGVQYNIEFCEFEYECRKVYSVCCEDSKANITYLSTYTIGTPMCTQIPAGTMPAPNTGICVYNPCE